MNQMMVRMAELLRLQVVFLMIAGRKRREGKKLAVYGLYKARKFCKTEKPTAQGSLHPPARSERRKAQKAPYFLL